MNLTPEDKEHMLKQYKLKRMRVLFLACIVAGLAIGFLLAFGISQNWVVINI